MKNLNQKFENIAVEKKEAKVKKKQEENIESGEREPITEDENSVSYLGVRLEKAEKKDGVYVPRREDYLDYSNDDFPLSLQKKFATSFALNEPILMESGTSIGKTTTVRKMAADLGWELHYVNLTGATDVEDLMGRYIPNPNKRGEDDPEYIFADGKVTSGLRREEGKKKLIILDEFNSGKPNITIRMHEVLDALERNGQVVLSEDASESVNVSKADTRIVALMNPPGKGYLDRDPLDPAQLRRWVYQKEVTELPKASFSNSVDVLFAMMPNTVKVESDKFMNAGVGLTLEQLGEIPGIREITAKYKEFHETAKKMLKARKIAEDQPQSFSFDDRMEPRRVRDFVARFYNGDITETFQKALEYFYAGKLESEDDMAKLREIINHVAYEAPKKKTKRKGLDEEPEPQIVQGEESESGERDKALSEIEDLEKEIFDIEDSARSPETPEDSLSFSEFSSWLTKEGLDHRLEGGSFEVLIKNQEEYYRKLYGADFHLDRAKIFIEAKRLPNIKKALENGSINFPLITAIPEKLTKEERKMTEAEFAYHKLLAPLEKEGLKLWDKDGKERWTKLDIEELVKRYIPVTIEDFDSEALAKDWQKEIKRVIAKKKQAPKIILGQIKLTFTDNRKDVPKEQKLINSEGQEVINEYSFIWMIGNKVTTLTPDQWITLASQAYSRDKTELSRNTWDWMMAILDHSDKGTDPPVSAARADSVSVGLRLCSGRAGVDDVRRRWRSSL